MAETGITAESPLQSVESIGSADVLVAIPTYNDAETIGPLVKAASAGLARFTKQKVVLAQIDGGSTDSTMQRALEAAETGLPLVQMHYPIYPVHRLSASDRGVPGRESAYHTIFSLARDAGVKACCVVEPDITSVTPEWIVSLIQPILDTEFDIVVPYYQRTKYEGLLVAGLLYPAVRALFGKRIRHPVGNDFGLSAALIERCLKVDSWHSDVRREVDLWISLQAILAEMRVCQVRLGARPRPKKSTNPDLSSILANLVGALYSGMEHTAELWQRIRSSQPVPTFGLRFTVDEEVAPVDVTRMMESFRVGYENLKDIWTLILPPASLLELKKISRLPEQTFRINDDLWARTVYDFGVGHRLGTIGREHLLRALTPLYMGWAASFILEIKDSHASQVEQRIEQLALAYEQQKPYLISRWRWPDRFTP